MKFGLPICKKCRTEVEAFRRINDPMTDCVTLKFSCHGISGVYNVTAELLEEINDRNCSMMPEWAFGEDGAPAVSSYEIFESDDLVTKIYNEIHGLDRSDLSSEALVHQPMQYRSLFEALVPNGGFAIGGQTFYEDAVMRDMKLEQARKRVDERPVYSSSLPARAGFTVNPPAIGARVAAAVGAVAPDGGAGAVPENGVGAKWHLKSEDMPLFWYDGITRKIHGHVRNAHGVQLILVDDPIGGKGMHEERPMVEGDDHIDAAAHVSRYQIRPELKAYQQELIGRIERNPSWAGVVSVGGYIGRRETVQALENAAKSDGAVLRSMAHPSKPEVTPEPLALFVEATGCERQVELLVALGAVWGGDNDGKRAWLQQRCDPIGGKPIELLRDGRVGKVIDYLKQAA